MYFNSCLSISAPYHDVIFNPPPLPFLSPPPPSLPKILPSRVHVSMNQGPGASTCPSPGYKTTLLTYKIGGALVFLGSLYKYIDICIRYTDNDYVPIKLCYREIDVRVSASILYCQSSVHRSLPLGRPTSSVQPGLLRPRDNHTVVLHCWGLLTELS